MADLNEACERTANARRRLGEMLRPFMDNSPFSFGMSRLWPESRWQWLHEPRVWLKREDELGFPCNGPKVRKLLSLAQAIATAKPQRIVSWGSSRSTFLLGLVQLAKGLNIPVELYLLRSTPWGDHGVDGLYRCLFGSESIHWVDRSDYRDLALQLLQRVSATDFYVPEGGAMAASLPGSLSLALEIVEQEARLKIDLDAIWIDAGSGFTAQALILGLGFLGRTTPVHVLLCAGNEDAFRAGLDERQREAEALWPDDKWARGTWTLHRPSTARSFGSINRQVWNMTQTALSEEGVVLDPLYNAKLYRAVQESPRLGTTLMIHSGGALSSFAYPDSFRDFTISKPNR